jgi:hypothetical protein
MGVPAETLKSVESLRQFARDSQTLWRRAQAQWKLIRHEPNRARTFVWVFAAAAVAPAAAFVVSRLGAMFGAQSLPGVWRGVTGGIASLGTLAMWLKPYAARVSQGLAVIEEKNREVDAWIAQARDEQEKRVKAIESDVNALAQRIVAAQDEAAKNDRDMAALRQEIANTTPGNMVAQLIEDRANATDYRRHLGMVALIRRDFESLSELFQRQREEEEKRAEQADAKTVNRIILYIDDLDRCPPKRVVDVLQAIHLLLAFPLFVVVVGVDARWVSESLEQSFEWLRGDRQKSGAESDGAGAKSREETLSSATPHDYLEKIFQIPFWLRPMGAGECQSLIAGLTKDSRRRASEMAGPKPAPPIPAAVEHTPETSRDREGAVAQQQAPLPHGRGSLEAEKQVPVEHEPAPEPEVAAAGVDLSPRSLDLDQRELEWMDALAGIAARSPRAVKRFVNCYRLIKATHAHEVEHFVKHDAKAVLTLLAIATGAPAIAHQLLAGLTRTPAIASLADLDTAMAHEIDWPRIKKHLEADSALSINVLAAQAPDVSRYSFRTGWAGPKIPKPEPPAATSATA